MGHNPAGSLAIWLILTLGFICSISGLLLLGGEERHGPFAGWLDFPQSRFAEIVHTFSAWTLLGLVIIHIAGVVVSSYLHRENLVKSMVTGWKASDSPQSNVALHGIVASLVFLATLTFTTGYFYGYVASTGLYYSPFANIQLATHQQWQKICGECHLAYHPSLLPVRSWKKMFAEQHKHFGEDLDLAETDFAILTDFAFAHAAETWVTEPAWKISRSIPSTQAPLRISETAYWVEKHEKISEPFWKQVRSRANCEACHLDAKQGTFEDGTAIRLPKLGNS